MKRYTTFLVLSSLLFLAWSAFAPAEKNIVLEENWETKISPQLTTKALRGETLDFLVILKNQKDVSEAKHLKSKAAKANYVFSHLRQHARISQKGILKMLNQAQAIYQPFNIVNAIHVKGDYELLKKIAQRTEVQQINDNSPVLLEEPVEKIYTNTRGPNAIEWGLEMINADDVWNMGYKGQHVVVGGQDTGYNWEHPALSAKYRGNQGNTPDHNYNWHDAIREINPLHEDSTLSASNNPCGLDVPFPCDDVGSTHGTHTMGTMVGEDGDNQIGVAPDAQWVACRNMERGYGTPSTYIECFEWFMAPTDLNNENADPTKAPHVIANSWSCPPVEGCDSTNWHVMELVVENLKASGVVVVVSAGNSGGQGCGSVKTPAAMFEPSFSVGATAANDTIADFSSKGAVTINGSGLLKPNVSAPGVLVRSSVKDSSYASYSGTSMAGPHAAGMVALMISANPDLAGQVEVIEDLIEQTAAPKTDTLDCGGISSQNVPNNIYGYGRIDALAAVNAALAWTSTTDNDAAAIEVKVYPNPTEDLVFLEIRNWEGDVDFELYDIAGHLIETRQWNLLEYQIKSIDLNALPTGVYFYKIKNERARKSGKLFKK